VCVCVCVRACGSGTPYILYKDSANRKSNQQNLGTIRCSNLCTEILEYTSPDEVAVCNLASIALPRFVDAEKFDHERLRQITYIVTRNLNRVIDHNYCAHTPSRSRSRAAVSLSHAPPSAALATRCSRPLPARRGRRPWAAMCADAVR
jgi:hypothetical protein